MEDRVSRRRLLRRGLTISAGITLAGIAVQAGSTGSASADFPFVQFGWAYCRKCKGLFYRPGIGVCTASSGGHDASLSGNYGLDFDGNPPKDPAYLRQQLWMHCKNCQGIHYVAGVGRCPVGGDHIHEGSFNYGLHHSGTNPSEQIPWVHCKNCQGLHYLPEITNSWCPAGGRHTSAGSLIYSLPFQSA